MNPDSLLIGSVLKAILIVFALSYTLMGAVFFKHWLKAVYRDPMMDAEEMFISKVILAIATLFWPVVVPFCYLELSTKFRRAKHHHPVESDSP